MAELDILIKNGTVIDGTGAPAFQADVGVLADRIVLVGASTGQQAARVFEASGLCLAPGFIDAHSHSDLTLLANPRAQSVVRQGVTTQVIGNCGISHAPLSGAALEESRAEGRNLGLEVTWTSMAGYLERLGDSGSAVNVVPLVGHKAIRGAVLGFGEFQPTPKQQAKMERLVAEAMEQGARGFSTLLRFPPGCYSTTEEVAGLARVAARYGGIYSTHLRSESDRLLEAVDEALEIGRQADVRVQISHVKLQGFQNWDGVDELLAVLVSARGSGLDVGCDQYPYTASLLWLRIILPGWAQAGGAKAIAERLSDPQVRARLRRDWKDHRDQWEGRRGVRDWSDILVAECFPRPDVLGRSISEVAAGDGQDPLETLFDLIAVSEGQAVAVFFDQLEDNVRTLLRRPMVAIGSDGQALAPDGVLGVRRSHPRCYGTFPRVLGHYVRDEHLLSLEDAVRKMTGLTAERLGLSDRGVIREGARADLVLFDPHTIADRATFADPHQYPAGIQRVMVNGVMVVEQGEHTGSLPGRVL